MFGDRLPVLGVLIWLALQGCTGFMTSVGGGLTPELQASGVPATAEILEIWDTGWTLNDNPVIGMKVLVRPPDRPDFEATINKTTVSRIALAQFQPGSVIPVRFDPQNPAVVAVDPEGGETPATGPSSGNPYRDRYERTTTEGPVLLPPPETPELFLGTGDMTSDFQTLFENDFTLLGSSSVRSASDPGQALEQGREIGAALVVVYGHFQPSAGQVLELLPYSRRSATAAAGAASRGSSPLPARFVSGQLGPDDQFATYWGRTRPPILGIVSRTLNAQEQSRLGRKDGIVIQTVINGSPAEVAGIAPGDIVVAINGQALTDPRAVADLVTSLAGRVVSVDLVRAGQPLSVAVQLNRAEP